MEDEFIFDIPVLGTDRTAGVRRITNDTLIRFKKEVARLEKQHKRVRGGETLVRLVEMTTSLARDEILDLTPVALEDIVRRVRIEVLGPEKTFDAENPDTGEKVEVTVNLEEIEITPPVMEPETYDLRDGIKADDGEIHKTITIGPPTVKDLVETEKKHAELVEFQESMHAACIMGIGDLPRPVTGSWRGFFGRMTIFDRKNVFLPSVIKHTGKIDNEIEVQTPSGDTFKVEVDFLDFFD
ncbi:MAG: hypothetical protein KJ621_07185 [Proteobacteria bacterium]|nr:hypothetical protein [Pseudomonadota bacterium]